MITSRLSWADFLLIVGTAETVGQWMLHDISEEGSDKRLTSSSQSQAREGSYHVSEEHLENGMWGIRIDLDSRCV